MRTTEQKLIDSLKSAREWFLSDLPQKQKLANMNQAVIHGLQVVGIELPNHEPNDQCNGLRRAVRGA